MNLPSQDFYLVFQWLFLAFESFFVYYFDCIHHWGIVLALGKSHLRECSAEKQNKKWNDAQKSTQIVSKHDTDVFKGKMNDKGRDWERKVTKSTQHSIPCFMNTCIFCIQYNTDTHAKQSHVRFLHKFFFAATANAKLNWKRHGVIHDVPKYVYYITNRLRFFAFSHILPQKMYIKRSFIMNFNTNRLWRNMFSLMIIKRGYDYIYYGLKSCHDDKQLTFPKHLSYRICPPEMETTSLAL